jgi:sialic acid synthase SpsE
MGVETGASTTPPDFTAVHKSLVRAGAFVRGTILAEGAISMRRPRMSLTPAMRSQLIGRRLGHDVPRGAISNWEMFS